MNKKIVIKDFALYFIVGGLSALTEWVTFFITNLFTHYVVSTGIAFIVATYVNYLLGRKLVFQNYKKSTKEMFKVFIVSALGLILNVLFMYLFVNFIKLSELFSKILSTGIVFFWNYLSRKMFIYNKNKN